MPPTMAAFVITVAAAAGVDESPSAPEPGGTAGEPRFRCHSRKSAASYARADSPRDLAAASTNRPAKGSPAAVTRCTLITLSLTA